MEVRALFGRFVWCGVNMDEVTIHPSRGSRINPTLKVCQNNPSHTLQGAIKELTAMEACKKQTNRYNYTFFSAATTLTSNIMAELIENHYEFCGCANSCNKFVSSRPLKNIKLAMILLWKSILSFKRVGEKYHLHFTALQRLWNYLWCCYVRAPMPTISKGKGGSAPVMQSRSSLPTEINRYHMP